MEPAKQAIPGWTPMQQTTRQLLDHVAKLQRDLEKERRTNRRLLRLIGQEFGEGERMLAERVDEQIALVPGVAIHAYPDKCGVCCHGWHPVAVSDGQLRQLEMDDETDGGAAL